MIFLKSNSDHLTLVLKTFSSCLTQSKMEALTESSHNLVPNQVSYFLLFSPCSFCFCHVELVLKRMYQVGSRFRAVCSFPFLRFSYPLYSFRIFAQTPHSCPVSNGNSTSSSAMYPLSLLYFLLSM